MKEPIAGLVAGAIAVTAGWRREHRLMNDRRILILCMIPTAVNGQTENAGASGSR